MITDYDVVIVGGGLVGASLALAISKFLRVLVLEAHARPSLEKATSSGERAIVLSAASQNILNTLDVWSYIAPYANPVKKVHVSDRGSFGAVRISAEAENVSALGYVVQAKYLDAQMAEALSELNVCYSAEFVSADVSGECAKLTYKQNGQEKSVTASLLVAADGQNSALRKAVGIDVATTEYNQHVIVSVVDLARSHLDVAYERFTAEGPLAFLPLQNQSSALVWTVPSSAADAILSASPEEFLTMLQDKFGYRLGRFLSANKPLAFPVVMNRAQELIKRHTVIIGNAANAIHPIAGQGLNLGLRDVAVLVDCLQQKIPLQEYVQRRLADHRDIIAITHNLVGIFSNAFLPLVVARSMGMVAMELVSVLKKWLAKRTMGYSGFTTPLVCGVKVE